MARREQPPRDPGPRPAEAPDLALGRQVELILSQISALPTLSTVAARLMTVAGADDADLSEIAQIIESDPGLAARILGLCRRADRGLAQRVTSVRHAVTLLGLDAVRACVLSVSIYDLMNAARPRAARLIEDAPDENALGAFDRPGFWRHSIAVACTCEMLAEEIPGVPVAPEEAFLAGLVHDLGTLALEFALPRSYQRVLELAERRRVDGAPVERAVMGIDRFAAGRRLGAHWRLPESIIDVVWLHGQPADAVPESSHRRLVALVTLARAFCRSLHIGWCADFSTPADPAPLCGPLGIDPGALSALAEPLQKAVSDRCTLLGLDSPPSTRVLLDALGGANRQLARLTLLLQERARLTAQQTKALAALRAFSLEHARSRGLVETLEAVAGSAACFFGPGPCVLVVRADESSDDRPQEPWRAHFFETHTGDNTGSRLVSCRSLAIDGSPAPRTLDECAARLRVMRAPAHRVSLAGPDPDAPVGALFVGVDPALALGHESIGAAVAGAWTAAIVAAQEIERSRALSDRLADVGRSLLEAQSRLAENESLARLGEMTAGAAHEMNNPLTVISGRSQLLAMRLRDAGDRAAAEAIADAAEDLSGLITSLHLLASPPRPAPARTPVSAVVDDALRLAEDRLKFAPRVQRSLDPAVADLCTDRDLTSRALAELIINAVEAAPEKSPVVRARPDPDTGKFLIEVLDDGAGMSRRALQHAFDPFFSEKPAGRQRGLGLTRARRLVEIQGGRVSLSLREEGGTRAALELPAPGPAARAGTTPGAPDRIAA